MTALRLPKRENRPHFFLAAGSQQVGAGGQQAGAGAGAQQTGAGAGQHTGAGAGVQQTGAGAGAGAQQAGAGASQQVGAGAQQSFFALRHPNKPASLVGAKITLSRATSPKAKTDRMIVSKKGEWVN